jgi:hypothetical protein
MKNFRDALLAIDTSGTETAMKNKFAKIAHATEDPTLKELCMSLSQWWGWYLKPGWSRRSKDPNTGEPINVGVPKTRNEWIEGYQDLRQRLREYCEKVIAQAKPEWMRMAEKHGWKPPETRAQGGRQGE